jgi:hypothetical protein
MLKFRGMGIYEVLLKNRCRISSIHCSIELLSSSTYVKFLSRHVLGAPSSKVLCNGRGGVRGAVLYLEKVSGSICFRFPIKWLTEKLNFSRWDRGGGKEACRRPCATQHEPVSTCPWLVPVAYQLLIQLLISCKSSCKSQLQIRAVRGLSSVVSRFLK